jgi:hypothetical protein
LVPLLLLLVLNPYVRRVVSDSLAGGQLSIQEADDAISSAFLAVIDAEKVGANVSVLLQELNGALVQKSQAEELLRGGDAGGAIEAAALSAKTAEDVTVEASNLRASTLAHRELIFKISLVGSSIGIIAFLSFMFLLWRRFKGYYVRRILDLRPVVVTDVEA